MCLHGSSVPSNAFIVGHSPGALAATTHGCIKPSEDKDRQEQLKTKPRILEDPHRRSFCSDNQQRDPSTDMAFFLRICSRMYAQVKSRHSMIGAADVLIGKRMKNHQMGYKPNYQLARISKHLCIAFSLSQRNGPAKAETAALWQKKSFMEGLIDVLELQNGGIAAQCERLIAWHDTLSNSPGGRTLHIFVHKPPAARLAHA